ncbi:PREDICTED: uncharacterized protein LOC105364728 [Ceratosolen solmsi marchali]|uniref:Uncharacterized protein LOC105364728 n=1 Tax=Ceratosolen solmsi marchali TaxID=326594 RepID=A0AAJ6YN09_9HYME|nr:PREDICTED: uncharacterized protein LOC105364728 [Ceratosolen solmsi marchali]
MERIEHLWNSLKYLTTLNGDEANVLRMYFVLCCKELLSNLQLPKQHFGPSVMCSECGSLWFKNKSHIRIIPGKSPSKSVKHIIKSYSKNNEISKFQTTLMKKSIKNKMNKILIKCLVCSQNTEICCNKLNGPKFCKQEEKKINVLFSQYKKKRKENDKTAGLNLPNTKLSNKNKNIEIVSIHSTPIALNVNTSKGKELSSIEKVRKINLTQLKSLLSVRKVKKSKNNLSNFLQELY